MANATAYYKASQTALIYKDPEALAKYEEQANKHLFTYDEDGNINGVQDSIKTTIDAELRQSIIDGFGDQEYSEEIGRAHV